MDFLVIYIEEAHASDGWRFDNNFDIKIHRKIEDRIVAAKKLRDLDLDPNCPIVVDRMDDEANKQYGGLYERLYIVLNDIIVYAGDRGPYGYRPEEVHSWLNNHLRS